MFSFSEWLKGFTRSGDGHADAQPASECAYEKALQNIESAPEEQLIAFSRDYSGHVREKAVRVLSSLKTQGAFLALIDRLNDWVPQVRDAARTGITPLLREEFLPLLLHGMPAFMALRGKGRADHQPILDQIARVLRQPSVRASVLALVPATTGKLARYLLEQLSTSSETLDEATLRVFAEHPDCIVRLRVVALCRNGGKGCPTIVEQLRQDRHPRVRREVLSVMWQSSADDARTALVTHALSDHASSVRELAVWYASKIGLDVRAWLLQRLPDSGMDTRSIVSTLSMLTSLKMQEGLVLARTAVASDLPTRRAAGLSALLALDRESADTQVTRMLTDPSRRVARLARAAVLHGGVALTREQFMSALQALLEAGDLVQIRATVAMMPLWLRLEALLICLPRIPSGAGNTSVFADLLEWERSQARSAIAVSTDERARLETLLTETAIRRQVEKHRRLTFALETVGLWCRNE